MVVHPPGDRPEEFGWAFSNDDKYIIKWFEGPAALHMKLQNLQYKMLTKVLTMLFVVRFWSKLK